jgi:3-phenylpropionate/trans-cinnamate dioxygenase ferredoxin reductase subunit
MIGDEPSPPYQRPPLSKAYLLGEMAEERLWLRAPNSTPKTPSTCVLGQPVTAIDPAAKTVTAGGSTLAYDHLCLTTGSAPRRLPAAIGGDLPGVYTVRTLADVDAMRAEFRPGAPRHHRRRRLYRA